VTSVTLTLDLGDRRARKALRAMISEFDDELDRDVIPPHVWDEPQASSGAYVGSLWMAGDKSKYYEHLTDWHRATGGDVSQVNGIAGASVGAGRTLEITLDLADALFDAGYTLHVDAAVEDMRDSPNEVAVPLTRPA